MWDIVKAQMEADKELKSLKFRYDAFPGSHFDLPREIDFSRKIAGRNLCSQGSWLRPKNCCSHMLILKVWKKKQITLDIIQNIILFTHFIRSQGALITSECDESSIEWTLAWSVLGFTWSLQAVNIVTCFSWYVLLVCSFKALYGALFNSWIC